MTNYIVCMSSIKTLFPDDPTGIQQLIVGTEGKFVYVMDNKASKIINKFKLEGIPVHLAVQGAYDTDYSIHIACRDNTIYTIKNGQLASTKIDLMSKISAMVRFDRNISVSTMDMDLISFSQHGKKNYSVKLDSPIVVLEKMDCVRTRGFIGLLAGLASREIRLYNEKLLIAKINLKENLMGLKFGRLGKEDDCLVISSEDGSVIVKKLSNGVNLDGISYKKADIVDKDLPLPVPKKTTLYLDLMEREKEMSQSK